ncbi:hypothetical protein Nepgr_000451 [Nepenthes gracilis]|uniref:H/ACA ribonucleoprotein complex non-core subunit NAF1 n=1 Tax=Nepenthes gracilis TaxID=150966 RepID=A0AAD3P6P4_NEPGR|nr:hypothetical protein Nepgr_000451 [Nepenthes gracilis]
MQSPDSIETDEVGIVGHGLEVSENEIREGYVDSMEVVKYPEKVGPNKVVDVDEHIVAEGDGFSGDVNVEQLIGVELCNTTTEQLEGGNLDRTEFIDVEKCIGMPNIGNSGEMNLLGDESPATVVKCGHDEKFGSLGSLIEQGIGKVSLVCGSESYVLQKSSMKETAVKNDEVDIDSSSESGSESLSPASSSSSSSGSGNRDNGDGDGGGDEDEDDDNNEEQKEVEVRQIKRDTCEEKDGAEEGEIVEFDSDKMVEWSDGNDDDQDNEKIEFLDENDGDEDDDGEGVEMKGPIRSKNELKVLPPVPPVNITLQPSHQLLPVGTVSSIIGAQVIVEGLEKHNPLNEGSILWMTESRLPLGIVDEIFGPVKNPYYVVRYNSESEVPCELQQGTSISFVSEFVDHVLNDKNLYQKGYDASGKNDEELSDEVEFSDDEKEAEYRRMMKMTKRENNEQRSGSRKKNRKNLKNRDKTITNAQPSVSPALVDSGTSQPSLTQPHAGAAPSTFMNYSNHASPSGFRPVFHAGPPGVSSFPQLTQTVGIPSSAVWTHGIPCQLPNAVFPYGSVMNGVPWLHQNHLQAFQTPPANMAPFQRQLGPSQGLLANNILPLGPTNLFSAPPTLPWPGIVGPDISNSAALGTGFQEQLPQLPITSGVISSQPLNLQPLTNLTGNAEPSLQLNQRVFSCPGRKPFQTRGRRFGGGRGRHQ